MMLCPTGVSILTTLLIIFQEGKTQQDLILDYHALGYTLTHQDTLHLSNVNGKLTFVIKLPSSVTLQTTEYDDCEQQPRLGGCHNLRPMINVLFQMRESMLYQLQSHLNTTYGMVDNLQAETRNARAASWVPTWLSRLFSSVTGLAESQELDTLKQTMVKLSSMVEEQSEVFAASQNHIGQVMKVQSDRLDSLERLAEISHRGIVDMSAMVRSFTRNQNDTNVILRYMLDYVRKFTSYLVDIEIFEQALQTLFNGHIPVSLVPFEDMRSMITSLQQFIREHHPHLTLVHEDLLYYYREAKFVVFRKDSQLLIHVTAPISSFEPRFRLFALQKLPLAVHGSEGVYSILSHPFKAIAVSDNHYFEISDDMDIASFPRYIDINKSGIHILSKDVPSCSTALLDGDLIAVKKLCTYHVVTGTLPKQVVRLSPTKVFVSNISSLLFQCDSGVINKSSEVRNTQAVLSLPCSCEILADQYVIPRLVRTCSSSDAVDFLNVTAYTVNLVYLSHFFDQSELQKITANTVFQTPPNISVPALDTNSQEFQAELAISQQSRFELNGLLNATRSQKSVFQSLGHLAMQKVWESNMRDESFNFLSARDWLLLILCFVCGFLAVFLIYLRIRINALLAVTVAVNQPALAKAADIPINLFLYYTTPPPPPTTTFSIKDFTQQIAQLIPLETMIMILLCLLICAFCLYKLRLWYRNRFPGSLTTLCLQVGNMQSSIVINWTHLVHPAEFYNFTIHTLDSTEPYFTLTPYCMGLNIVKICGRKLQADHIHLDLTADIKTKQLVSYLIARKLQQFLAHDYFMALLVKDSNGKIVSCTKIRSFQPPSKPSDNITPIAPPLYPTLP
jgi:hypothetical protein